MLSFFKDKRRADASEYICRVIDSCEFYKHTFMAEALISNCYRRGYISNNEREMFHERLSEKEWKLMEKNRSEEPKWNQIMERTTAKKSSM